MGSSVIPSGAHLVVFSFVLTSGQTYPLPLLLRLSLFIVSSFYLTSQAKYTREVELFRTVVSLDENPGEMFWKLLSVC